MATFSSASMARLSFSSPIIQAAPARTSLSASPRALIMRSETCFPYAAMATMALLLTRYSSSLRASMRASTDSEASRLERRMMALERTSMCLSLVAAISFSVDQLGSGSTAGMEGASAPQVGQASSTMERVTMGTALSSLFFSSVVISSAFFSSSMPFSFAAILLQLFPTKRPFYSHPEILGAPHRKEPPG